MRFRHFFLLYRIIFLEHHNLILKHPHFFLKHRIFLLFLRYLNLRCFHFMLLYCRFIVGFFSLTKRKSDIGWTCFNNEYQRRISAKNRTPKRQCHLVKNFYLPCPSFSRRGNLFLKTYKYKFILNYRELRVFKNLL